MNDAVKQKVIVIVGPTSSGKTSLAINLSKQFSGEVISADSRQVYRKLDIGTEKATQEEMSDIPHHLMDVCDVDTVYSAGDYKEAGQKTIDEITNRGNLPIIAGGTFFYIDTLLGKISTPEVLPNPELREALEKMDAQTLYESLLKLDPRRAEDIDPHNKRRLIRALEVVEALGKVPESKEIELPYDTCVIGIEVDRTELRKRIRSRAEEALTRGLIEETKELLASGISKARLQEIGLEYRVVLEYIAGELTDDQLIQKIEEKNWQYAKRQLSYLKRDASIQWFTRDEFEKVPEVVREFLKG